MRISSTFATVLLSAVLVSGATVVFQQGAGYSGAKDIELRDPNHNYNNGVFPLTGRDILSVIESNW